MQVTYTLELDEVGTVGAVFAATRDNTTASSPPKVIVPKEDWVKTGRPTVVTVVMGEIDFDLKHNHIAIPEEGFKTRDDIRRENMFTKDGQR